MNVLILFPALIFSAFQVIGQQSGVRGKISESGELSQVGIENFRIVCLPQATTVQSLQQHLR